MAKVNAQEWAEKHKQRLTGATEHIRRGVARVQEAPGVRAAAAKEKMKANLLKALDDGTWERAVASVSKEDWQRAITEKGIPRIAAGLDAAMTKNIRIASKLLNATDEASERVKAMPNNNIEDSIARMTAYAREMHSKKGTFKD